MNFFNNKKILVIGGTGSIGEKIVHTLLALDPDVIRIFSRDEYKQYLLHNKFNNNDKLRFLIGDIRDYDRVERACEDIDIVFHLAAMKHVPACEYNPFEAVKTNVIGTQNVIQAAMKNNVGRVVFTSSDKAVSPPNAMGATKLLAEKLISAANYSRGSAKTIFSAVRFGNVMGSRGSVINLFKKQIVSQRRVTVTDTEMTRFMMTLTEAANLTIKSAVNSKGGEVFVLKMPVIKLGDLVEVVIEEICSKYSIEIDEVLVENIGLRPGEKMYEELMSIEEAKNSFELEDMYSITPQLHEIDYSVLYKEYKKTNIQEISSNNVNPISKEEIRSMIVSENLI